MRAKVVLAGLVAVLCVLPGCAAQRTRTAPGPDPIVRRATPRLVSQVAPEYPSGFCGRGTGRAVVRVMALVGADGTVQNARVIQSVPALDAAAVACVKRWRFVPGHGELGQAINVWTPVDVRWDCSKRR